MQNLLKCGSESLHIAYCILHSHRHNLTVLTFHYRICSAIFPDGAVNYDDIDLTDYYLQNEHSNFSRYQINFPFIESLVGLGRFLDIGAGMGFSLTVAKQRGWCAAGLEPNATLAFHAQGLGLNVNKSYLCGEKYGKYDFTLIDNVLEHIPQPFDFLEHASSLLAPSGVILVAVSPLDWLRKWLGTISYVRNCVTVPQLNIFGEVDEYVNILSRKAIGRLLQSVGVCLLNVRFHHSLAYNNMSFRGLQLDDGYCFAAKA